MKFFLVLLAMMTPTAALAAEFVSLEDECNGRQLLIQGPIEPGDHQRFVKRMARLVAGGELPDVQEPQRLWTVRLDSPGGDVGEAMAIGRFLRQAMATTEVGYRFARRADGVYDHARSDETVCLEGEGRLDGCFADLIEAECAGACLLIWLGGADRLANEGALGLHGLPPDRDDDVDSYLRELGVEADWRRRIVSGAPPLWLSWPERHALAEPALALRELLAVCPDPLTAEESFQSVTAPSEIMRDSLMNRAAAHRNCRIERLAGARTSTVEQLEARL